MMRWKIKYLRLKIKRKKYYSDRLKELIEHKKYLIKGFGYLKLVELLVIEYGIYMEENILIIAEG